MFPLLVPGVTHEVPPVLAFQINVSPPLFCTISGKLCDLPADTEPKFKEVTFKINCGGCGAGDDDVGDCGFGSGEELTIILTCTLCFPPLEVIVTISE